MYISVIIPVYNVANFVERAVMSVVKAARLSKYEINCEVICIDDGSTDGSDRILDELAAAKYDNIKVLVAHQDNKGVAASRNAALDMAKGDYVIFLDGDDLVSRRIFDVIGEAVFRFGNTDFISWGHSEFVDDDDAFTVSPSDNPIRLEYIDVSKSISPRVYRILFWECAYSRALIGRQRFVDLTMGEDRTFYLSLLDRAKCIVCADVVCYGYRQRMGSAIHAPITVRRFSDDLHHYRLTFERIRKSHKKYASSFSRSFGLVLTEYRSSVFFSMCMENRKKAWSSWMLTLKSALENIPIKCWSRMVMRTLIVSNSQVLAWILCFLPYWLKTHGVNRKFVKVAK